MKQELKIYNDTQISSKPITISIGMCIYISIQEIFVVISFNYVSAVYTLLVSSQFTFMTSYNLKFILSTGQQNKKENYNEMNGWIIIWFSLEITYKNI